MVLDLFITPDWTLVWMWVILVIVLLLAIWTSITHITSFARLPLYIPLFFWGATILLSVAIWLKPKFDSLGAMLTNIGPYHIMWVVIGFILLIVLIPQKPIRKVEEK